MARSAGLHLSSQRRADSSQHCCSLRLLPRGPAQQGPLHYPPNAHTHTHTRLILRLRNDIILHFPVCCHSLTAPPTSLNINSLPQHGAQNPPRFHPYRLGCWTGCSPVKGPCSGAWRVKAAGQTSQHFNSEDIRMQEV